MPLKTVVPYTLLVDRQTGVVQQVDPLDVDMIGADEALTRSFLVQYVLAREGYDIDTIEEDYRKIALWSAGGARDSWLAKFRPDSPLNPFNRYRRETVIDAAVKSVTLLDEDSAMVRYSLTRADPGGRTIALGDRVSVIRLRYTNEPMTAADRLINPLGFEVLRYRSDVEALPDAEPPAAAEPAPQASPVQDEPLPDATMEGVAP